MRISIIVLGITSILAKPVFSGESASLDRELEKTRHELNRKTDPDYVRLEDKAKDLLRNNQSDESQGKIYAMLARAYSRDASQYVKADGYARAALQHDLPITVQLEMYSRLQANVRYEPLKMNERRGKREELVLKQLAVAVEHLSISTPMALPSYRPTAMNCSGASDECRRASDASKANQDIASKKYDEANLQNELLETKNRIIRFIGWECARGEFDPKEIVEKAQKTLSPAHDDLVLEIQKSVGRSRDRPKRLMRD